MACVRAPRNAGALVQGTAGKARQAGNDRAGAIVAAARVPRPDRRQGEINAMFKGFF